MYVCGNVVPLVNVESVGPIAQCTKKSCWRSREEKKGYRRSFSYCGVVFPPTLCNCDVNNCVV